MRKVHIFVATISRFFVSAVFLAGAIKNILNWHETEQEIMDVLLDWQSYASFSETLREMFSYLVPWVLVLQIVSVLLMLTGGLFVLLGVRKKLGVVLLILFLIPVTLLCHPFWFMEGSAREIQAIMFLKNLSILGCFLQQITVDQESFATGGDRPISMNLSRSSEF